MLHAAGTSVAQSRRVRALHLFVGFMVCAGVWLSAPLAVQAEVIQATDNDAENLLWDCSARRVDFGNTGEDVLRCFTFRFNVPAGGITSAVVYASIEAPTGSLQDTDATVVAVGQPFEDCAPLQGTMAGCIIVHGGFAGGERSLTLDLLNLACDPSFQGSPEKQAAMNAQLNTGVVHMLLQDDTAVHNAQLVLNEGGPTLPCGTSTDTTPTDTGGGGGNTGTGTGTGPGRPGGVPGNSSAAPPFGDPEPSAVSGMTLQAGQRIVPVGEFVWVPVYLVNGADVANVNFEIGYNGNVAVIEGEAQAGYLLGNQLFSSNAAQAGVVLGGFAGTTGINGTGIVGWLPFRAVGNPGDETQLNVGVTTINNPGGTTLSIDRIDGRIIIADENGLIPGDCEGNGRLNELDALCALQMSVQLIPERLVLDLDTDTTVTSRDSVLILQSAVGK